MFTGILSVILSKMLFFALHLESKTLPKPLSEKEERAEFEKYKNGDLTARDKLIRHNLRLVAHIAKKYYQNSQDNEDLMSIGTIGLIKAVQSFTYDKNTRFSTYASRCIENIVYLDDNLEINNDSSKISLKESLRDDFETEEFCENRETRREISTLVAEKLQGRERQIIIMRYGIGGTEPMTQQRVSEILGISRSYVSRLETKAINTLRQELTATANSSD